MSPPISTPALLVLAAGLGSRYGGLKQMDSVGPSGETVLDYSVYDARRAGFTDIVFVIRREFAAAFREKIGRRFDSRLRIRYVFQEMNELPAPHQAPDGRTKPWGTGHALWCARNELKQPFAVINADDYYGEDSFRQLARFLQPADSGQPPATACMVGYQLAKTLSPNGSVSRGVCRVDQQSLLASVHEHTALRQINGSIRQEGAGATGAVLTGDEIVSMNCWGFYPSVFPHLDQQLREFLGRDGLDANGEFQLPTAITRLIAQQQISVRVLTTGSNWFGITYREDFAPAVYALRQLIGTGHYPENLWN